MNTRYLVPLLCIAAVAYACGPWVHRDAQQDVALASALASRTNSLRTPAASGRAHTRTPQVVATTFDVIPHEGRVGFALRVENNTKKTVELRFPNGQTHDFTVFDANGKPVWRWSNGRMFTQTMQSKTVKSRDTLIIEEDWNAARAHGTYVAVATLNTTAHPIERRVAFTLP